MIRFRHHPFGQAIIKLKKCESCGLHISFCRWFNTQNHAIILSTSKTKSSNKRHAQAAEYATLQRQIRFRLTGVLGLKKLTQVPEGREKVQQDCWKQLDNSDPGGQHEGQIYFYICSSFPTFMQSFWRKILKDCERGLRLDGWYLILARQTQSNQAR